AACPEAPRARRKLRRLAIAGALQFDCRHQSPRTWPKLGRIHHPESRMAPAFRHIHNSEITVDERQHGRGPGHRLRGVDDRATRYRTQDPPSMRIAQISPLFEAVPPKLYGGTERVVYSLTEELVAMGHDVTLFASGDSVTSATLAPMREQAIRLDPSVKDPIALHYRMIEQVYRRKDEFDVLHSHLDYFPLSLLTRQNVPYLTTLHGRLDLEDFVEIFGTFRDAPFVSISHHQR